jgi:hypothetical protein
MTRDIAKWKAFRSEFPDIMLHAGRYRDGRRVWVIRDNQTKVATQGDPAPEDAADMLREAVGLYKEVTAKDSNQ